MFEAACLALCLPEDQQAVPDSLSTPVLDVEFEVVVQKPGQVVKVKARTLLLCRLDRFAVVTTICVVQGREGKKH